MTTVIGIPVSHSKKWESVIAGHFGKSKYYAIITEDALNIIPNTSKHFDGDLSPPELLMQHGVNVVVSRNMGTGAINKFQNADVAVFQMDDKRSIQEVVNTYREGKLKELTEGCSHGTDHHH